MNPLKVLLDIIMLNTSITGAFSTIMFTPWLNTAGVDLSLFNILFNPGAFFAIFGLVVAKKLVPLI